MSFFENKTAVITGAGGSIGAAIAKQLIGNGCNVALVDYDISAMERAAQELKLPEKQYCMIQADVSKEEDVRKYVQKFSYDDQTLSGRLLSLKGSTLLAPLGLSLFPVMLISQSAMILASTSSG